MELPRTSVDISSDPEREGSIQTNWWVITGGPSAGKTTLIERLKALGYTTIGEAARAIIDEGMAAGKSLEEIRGDRVSFQQVVFERKEVTEGELLPDECVFLDRGSHGDTHAYLAFSLGLTEVNLSGDFPGKEVISAPPLRRYRGVFLLDGLPYESDYARDENAAEAELLHGLIGEAYRILGYEPIAVPALPIDERVEFILAHIDE